MPSWKLRKLVKKYASASWVERKSAIEEMANLDEWEKVTTVVSALGDVHPDVRAAAERALRTVNVLTLADAIASAPDSTRHILVKAMGPAMAAEIARRVMLGLVKDSELGDYTNRGKYTPQGLAAMNAWYLQVGTTPFAEGAIKALAAVASDRLPAVRLAAGESAMQVADVCGLVNAGTSLLVAPEAERLAAARSLGPTPTPEAVIALLKRRQAALEQFVAALRDGDMEAFTEALQAGAKLDVQLKDGSSPLHIAASHGQTGLIAFLLSKGLAVNAADEIGRTPLHLAASCGFPGAAAELLKGRAYLEAKTKEGLTPLHAAAQNGHVDLARLLLDAGAQASAIDAQGRTPLALAEAGGHSETADLLRQRKCTPPTPPPTPSASTSQGSGCRVTLLLAGALIIFMLLLAGALMIIDLAAILR